MIVRKRTNVHFGNGTSKDIIAALTNAELPDKAALCKMDYDVMDVHPGVPIVVNAIGVFEWWDEE